MPSLCVKHLSLSLISVYQKVKSKGKREQKNRNSEVVGRVS